MTSFLFSTRLEVSQDGTCQYSVIQEAINASITGDTVYVHPGIYYENLIINKSISLVSDYEYTGNNADARTTVLDGNYSQNDNGSVIFMKGQADNYWDIYICGFVIQHGSGHNEGWANDPDPGYRAGGGVYARFVNLTLRKNLIRNNKAQQGGGIEVFTAIVTLKENTICYNEGYAQGGGITIRCNQNEEANMIFDPNLLNNIYCNYSGRGQEINTAVYTPNINVIVDTFTVENPDFYYLYAADLGGGYIQNKITYNIQHSKIPQVESDLYVSTEGDNENSGFTPEDPLQTIAYALNIIKADSLHHRTIYVANGVYSESENNQYFPLHLKSYVDLEGESKENTILDREGGIFIIYSFSYYHTNPGENGNFVALTKDCKIENFKLINQDYWNYIRLCYPDNIYLNNIECTENTDLKFSTVWLIEPKKMRINNLTINKVTCGVGILVYSGLGVNNFTNIVINDNYPNTDPGIEYGVGMSLVNNNIYSPNCTNNIINSQITNNQNVCYDWSFLGSGIIIGDDSKVNLINSTISGNQGVGNGGAISLKGCSYGDVKLNIYNSILYGDTPNEIVLDGSRGPTELTVKNSLVQGGQWDIVTVGSNILNWLGGNIDEDPLFMGGDNIDDPNYYRLTEGSPCIDAGTLDLPEGVVLPETDLAGNPRIYGDTIDMGAYEWQGTDGNENNTTPTVEKSRLLNWPNPFGLDGGRNGTGTNVKLYLQHDGDVDISIYNIRGQKVRTLSKGFCVKGEYNNFWNGTNDNNKRVSSGNYFIKLSVDGEVQAVRKCLLLK